MSSSVTPVGLYASPNGSLDAARISGLLSKLNYPQSAHSAYLELMACGAGIVGQLADALLNGKWQPVPEPRCYLVKLLVSFSAQDVLVEFLNRHRFVEDPRVRSAEDAVMDSAARALKFDFSAEAYYALLKLARSRALPGALESLGAYRRIECIPYFIKGLESDWSRAAAMQALECFGDLARAHLLSEALTPRPAPPDCESISSVHRRRACLKLLRSLWLTSSQGELILRLFADKDPEVALHACAIALASSIDHHRLAAMKQLKTFRPLWDGSNVDELEELGRPYESAREVA